MMLTVGMVVLALVTFAAMIGFVAAVRPRVGAVMTLLSLILSLAAFVYLVYAMLRPEKF